VGCTCPLPGPRGGALSLAPHTQSTALNAEGVGAVLAPQTTALLAAVARLPGTGESLSTRRPADPAPSQPGIRGVGRLIQPGIRGVGRLIPGAGPAARTLRNRLLAPACGSGAAPSGAVIQYLGLSYGFVLSSTTCNLTAAEGLPF